MVYVDDLNVLGNNIDMTKKNHRNCYASKKVDLEINAEKTKCMLLSHHQNVEQIHDIKRANRCVENVAQVKYLGTTVTNQSLIQGEIKRGLNSGNACYHSIQKLLSLRLLPKNIKIKI
jgi:hypothetical protein